MPCFIGQSPSGIHAAVRFGLPWLFKKSWWGGVLTSGSLGNTRRDTFSGWGKAVSPSALRTARQEVVVVRERVKGLEPL